MVGLRGQMRGAGLCFLLTILENCVFFAVG